MNSFNQKMTEINNDIINMQRELSKKNAYILDLLNKKEEMNIELEALNATKDRLFSIIGHDLRAPLSDIISSINLIATNKFIYEELKEENFFIKLKDSAANTMLLLENLLEWSKSERGELSFFPTVFILQESIQTVINLLKGVAANKRINIVEEINNITYVYADKRMIEVILRNILSNAIKFTNEDGKVNVEACVYKEFAKITIIDNGIGMSEEKLKTIFDLKTNNVIHGTKGEKGTGFGLVLCKNLIEQNGGSMSIASDIDKGSEFTFTVPLSKKEDNLK